MRSVASSSIVLIEGEGLMIDNSDRHVQSARADGNALIKCQRKEVNYVDGHAVTLD
jgi:hypothetical protein